MGSSAPRRVLSLGQLRAKIDALIESRQVPNVGDPEATSELLREAFVREIWPAVQGDYQKMMDGLKELLEKGLMNEGIHAGLFARVKKAESIKKSIQRRDDHLFKEKGRRFESFDEVLRHIHDLVGLRIVLLFRDQLTKAKEFIERTFVQQGEPTYFSPNREVGQQWKKFEFGAYETYNYRLSHPAGQYRDVTFEVQLTQLGGHLFNMLGHSFLYKRAYGPLTKDDEMKLDNLHGAAKSLALSIQQLLDGRLGPSSPMQGIQQDGALTRDLVSRIIQETETTLSSALKGGKDNRMPVETENQGDAVEQLSKKIEYVALQPAVTCPHC
ncbi:hypothetical protein MAPG_11244 [Magnaporthiopsis poae ATCC 64411]|uniref:RelA/SpoT domain-containing protein n=1 Tax=Magnaporthiopsis poae (strain ATCC 64411 / 73-15) TaxID=644358 RepID=A0A0C4EER5_MAGP6|nr:hypothetical protein MAPG_11244 [Magnaporthiopsis poae ATCC 64411]